MHFNKVFFCILYLIAFCTSATAQSFLEKEQLGVDLTDVELTNLFLAEIKDCELRVPKFKSESKLYKDKFTNSLQFKKVAEKKGFNDPILKSESIKFVTYKRKNSNVDNDCKHTLSNLKGDVRRSYENQP